MARTIAEIKKQMTDAYIGSPVVQERYGLSADDVVKGFDANFSKVSIENIYFYVIATAIWTLEKLFDLHKAEITDYISRMKPHTSAWYVTKAKAFQYGFDLLPDSELFDNTGKTAEQIEASKIVKFTAVVEQSKQMLIKVAKKASNDLAALSDDELNSFTHYIERIKDAGVHVRITSGNAEKLRLRLKIYYNPLVLQSDGKRIDGTSATPVVDTVKRYLQDIEFDGTVVLAHLTDALQQIDGVVIPHIMQAAYSADGMHWIDFDVMHRPMSGYIRLNEASQIIYEPRNVLQ